MLLAGRSPTTCSRVSVSDMGFGKDIVSLARRSLEYEVGGGPAPAVPDDIRFGERSGAFVTLSEYPSGALRGCIGFPMPVFPLGEAVVQAARSACHDPRFPDLEAPELREITVEVTVLTVPERIRGSPSDIEGSIAIGRDGLIIDLLGRRGLFLPQVPVEQGWGVREYLENLGLKAGLPPDSWMDPRAVISSFKGEIWTETSPDGPVEEHHGRYRYGVRGKSLHRRRSEICRGGGDGGRKDRRRRKPCSRRGAQDRSGIQQDPPAGIHRPACAFPRSRDDAEGGFRHRDAVRRPCGRVLRLRHAEHVSPGRRRALAAGEEGGRRPQGGH